MTGPSSVSKIGSIDDLVLRVEEHKAAGKRVVLCHGVFDLLHFGHIHHFEQARSLGDVLVVTATPDHYVNKGPHRPAFPQAVRAQMLASLEVVDFVAVNEWPTAVETLSKICPHIYCKGSEYLHAQVDASENLNPEIEIAEKLGIAVAYTQDDVVFSSSELLNRHFSPFSTETNAWLDRFRDCYAAEELIQYLDSFQQKRVIVVGEAIIDEYVYCATIGKSTKDPVLACQHLESEAFAGGSLAVANHLAGFCSEVTLVTFLGETDSHETFVRDVLRSNVRPIFVEKEHSPTIQKRRYVDQYTGTKLLELYTMNDSPLTSNAVSHVVEALTNELPNHDVAIVADYGHGLMTREVIDLICGHDGFLALNTQSNAGNRGFNPISKYHRADYVCLAHHEIEMETRMRNAPLKDLLQDVAQRIEGDFFTVTRGADGSLHYSESTGYVEVPSFASHIVDRVGAGDAFLAVTSLLLSQGAPWDLVGFIGNVAGAQVVSELGNRSPLDRVSVGKNIVSLLK
jgi:rfaE bifunctional protein kinase chain/domain/rfaE bifunctional protein nucleotidyltransferase chain/domain